MDIKYVSNDFNHAMFKFCKRLTENNKTYTDRFEFMEGTVYAPSKGGSRFVKVLTYESRIETDYETGKKTIHKDKKGRIHCFVEKETGDVYKPATWRAPYTKGKNAVRANIYDPTTFENTDPHGGWLYDNSSFNKK